MENKLKQIKTVLKSKLASERGEVMGDSFVMVIGIVLVAVMMFIFPLMSISERTDDIAQLSVQQLTSDFVNEVRTTGKMTDEDYTKFEQALASTGNSYDVELEFQILDENVGVKTAQADLTKIGENQYYTKYTTQILEELGIGTNTGKHEIYFNEGDIITVNVKNTNTTISQILRNFIYRVTGNTAYQISASQTGIVTVSGK